MKIVYHGTPTISYAELWCAKPFYVIPWWTEEHKAITAEYKGDEHEIGCTHKLDLPHSAYAKVITWAGYGIRLYEKPLPDTIFIEPGVNQLIPPGTPIRTPPKDRHPPVVFLDDTSPYVISDATMVVLDEDLMKSLSRFARDTAEVQRRRDQRREKRSG